MNQSINYMVIPGMRGRVVEPVRWFDPGVVIKTVLDYYGISKKELMRKRRATVFVNRRQVCWYLLRKCTRLTVKQIGDKFGTHYSNIIIAVTKVDKKNKVHPMVLHELNELKYQLATHYLRSEQK